MNQVTVMGISHALSGPGITWRRQHSSRGLDYKYPYLQKPVLLPHVRQCEMILVESTPLLCQYITRLGAASTETLCTFTRSRTNRSYTYLDTNGRKVARTSPSPASRVMILQAVQDGVLHANVRAALNLVLIRRRRG